MDPSWATMFSSSPMASPMMQQPQGQFNGPDPINQSTLQALHRNNELLSHNIQAQYMTHLHNLQQQQAAHQSNPPPVSSHGPTQPQATQVTQPPPSMNPPDVKAPVTTNPPTPATAGFDPAEMLNQVKLTLQEGLAAAAASTRDTTPPPPLPPPSTAPPQHSSHIAPSTVTPPPQAPPPSQRSRSRHYDRAPAKRRRSNVRSPTPDKRSLSVPRSPRRERHHSRDRPASRHPVLHVRHDRDHRRRDPSKTPDRRHRSEPASLRSVSPGRRYQDRSTHHEQDRPSRLGHLRPSEPRYPPSSQYQASSWHQSHGDQSYQPDPTSHSDDADWDSWGNWHNSGRSDQSSSWKSHPATQHRHSQSYSHHHKTSYISHIQITIQPL